MDLVELVNEKLPGKVKQAAMLNSCYFAYLLQPSVFMLVLGLGDAKIPCWVLLLLILKEDGNTPFLIPPGSPG